MRRTPIIVALAGALALSGQDPALAHGHHAHAHAGRSHRRAHHAHARIERFSASSNHAPAGSAPAAPATEAAATVASFEGGLLTLRLADGTTVQGHVTSDTDITCPASGTVARASEDGGGAGRGDSPPEGSGEGAPASSHDGGSNDQEGSAQDDQDEHEASAPAPCGETALKPEALVGTAELRVGAGAATFVEIQLVG